MTDFFQRLSEQVLNRAVVVQPARAARFALMPEINLPTPFSIRQTKAMAPSAGFTTVDEATTTKRFPRPLVAPENAAATGPSFSLQQMGQTIAARGDSVKPRALPMMQATGSIAFTDLAEETPATVALSSGDAPASTSASHHLPPAIEAAIPDPRRNSGATDPAWPVVDPPQVQPPTAPGLMSSVQDGATQAITPPEPPATQPRQATPSVVASAPPSANSTPPVQTMPALGIDQPATVASRVARDPIAVAAISPVINRQTAVQPPSAKTMFATEANSSEVNNPEVNKAEANNVGLPAPAFQPLVATNTQDFTVQVTGGTPTLQRMSTAPSTALPLSPTLPQVQQGSKPPLSPAQQVGMLTPLPRTEHSSPQPTTEGVGAASLFGNLPADGAPPQRQAGERVSDHAVTPLPIRAGAPRTDERKDNESAPQVIAPLPVSEIAPVQTGREMAVQVNEQAALGLSLVLPEEQAVSQPAAQQTPLFREREQASSVPAGQAEHRLPEVIPALAPVLAPVQQRSSHNDFWGENEQVSETPVIAPVQDRSSLAIEAKLEAKSSAQNTPSQATAGGEQRSLDLAESNLAQTVQRQPVAPAAALPIQPLRTVSQRVSRPELQPSASPHSQQAQGQATGLPVIERGSATVLTPIRQPATPVTPPPRVTPPTPGWSMTVQAPSNLLVAPTSAPTAVGQLLPAQTIPEASSEPGILGQRQQPDVRTNPLQPFVALPLAAEQFTPKNREQVSMKGAPNLPARESEAQVNLPQGEQPSSPFRHVGEVGQTAERQALAEASSITPVLLRLPVTRFNPPQQASPQRVEPAAELTLRVTIGRVEVRQAPETPPTPIRRRSTQPGLSLDAYLARTQQGRS
ncbi:MAG: hypothetical protein U0350_11160 [Caldilineaceae bacterium]